MTPGREPSFGRETAFLRPGLSHFATRKAMMETVALPTLRGIRSARDEIVVAGRTELNHVVG